MTRDYHRDGNSTKHAAVTRAAERVEYGKLNIFVSLVSLAKSGQGFNYGKLKTQLYS